MQYMLLIYGDEKLWEELPREEAERIQDERDLWTQSLVRSGHLRGMAGLQPASTATTLRESNGRVEIIDGPCVEVREELRGYQLVECRNLDEALALASRYPALQAGFSMEVRPVIPQ